MTELVAVPDTDNDTAPTPVIDEGTYHLNIDCPECGRTAVFPIELMGRLTVDPNGAKLKPTMSAKSVDHRCGKKDDDTEPMF